MGRTYKEWLSEFKYQDGEIFFPTVLKKDYDIKVKVTIEEI